MYNAPAVQRFGTLRELTLGGGTDVTDPFGPTSDGNAGCIPDPSLPGANCINS